VTESGAGDIKLAEQMREAANHLDKHAQAMWDAKSRDFANACRRAAERLKALAQITDEKIEKSKRDSGD
jgi:hypothetical protein